MKTTKLKMLIVCIVVSGIVGLMASPAEAVIILYQSPNTAIYLGESYASLEFENPLAGTEMIKQYGVKEWMDADYDSGPPRWYDDWNVNDSAGIDGYAQEIWMRWGGHSIWTASTVPSTVVSIHLHGDDNDGIAEVLVDGILVARIDMGTNPGAQNALIIVKDLANITHHIRVNDAGTGVYGDDVATLGAAALEQRIKWSQPPIETMPTNLYYGWNEISIYDSNQIVADDWVCDNDDPITDLHWWGSFKDWIDSNQPPANESPTSFHITIWTDVPDPDPTDPNTFSHPNEVVWETDCYNFTTKFVGWDFDPRTNCYEACFYYEQDLTEAEYFFQRTNSDGTASIYWVSIAAQYPAGSTGAHPWGWKTRRRDPLSPAPDDAVKISKPTKPHLNDKYQDGKPIYWPDPLQSWDMAFELTAKKIINFNKFKQDPNGRYSGLHCHDSQSLTGGYSYINIADDWTCQGGQVTDLHWWGNYELDAFGQEKRGSGVQEFHLSIHNTIPLVPCLPEATAIWDMNVPLGAGGITETPTIWTSIDGSTIYLYEYDLPTPFPQEIGQTYWFDIIALAVDPLNPAIWRWQESGRMIMPPTCPAVSRTGPMPLTPWQPIQWPSDTSSEMAFAITSTAWGDGYVKWSQLPERYTPKAYDGWNELSVYNWHQIAADDWFCDTDNPVTDIHWWGSYIGWSCEDQPPQIPDSFHIAIWTDVPPDTDPDIWFSHPGTVIWETVSNNFTTNFDGWDIDPRDPNAPPETCFKFELDLHEDEWFHQKRGGNIYWISIAAQYLSGTTVEHPWGWKTRLRDLNSRAPDDAVRIFDPTAPMLGSMYFDGYPIYWPIQERSWDLAFVLTTKEPPPKKPVPHLKWSQPPIEIDPNSRIPEYSGWDEPSFVTPIGGTYHNMRIVADDYRCLGSMPVTSIHWWGSYYGLVDPGTMPPELPTSWKIGFWSNVPKPDGVWDLGDPHKMHYPQLPDPNGWDLDITSANVTADDWKCTKSGYVTDIHFWYSWLGDNVGKIDRITATIYDNVPEDPGDPASYSHPGIELWTQDFLSGQFTTRLWGNGNQGFMFPPGTNYITDDHNDIYQCNITNIQYPLLHQTAGDIYWLALTISIRDPLNTRIGWKTTKTQYMDDAVYLTTAVPPSWGPWKEPLTGDGNSLDTAFVITNDPNYSRPEKLLWEFEVPQDRVKIEEVGTDFYHNQYPNDVAYQYTVHLEQDEIFWQGDYLDRTIDDIFWLSIVAVYDSPAGTDPVYPWGWKTRPWHWMDDAVRFVFNGPGPLDEGTVLDPHTIEPIKDPLYRESVDVAFELDTDPNYIKWEQPFIGIRKWPHYEDEKSMAREVTTTSNVTKWAQMPDLTDNGVDVDATDDGTAASTQLLADDFECITAETIDDIHVYGSWKGDNLPGFFGPDPAAVNFTLSIHKDIPDPDPLDPATYSMPGQMIWSEDFIAGNFTVDLISTTALESYYMPCTGQYSANDHTGVYRYNFFPTKPFPQEGSTDNPIIYWLDVQATPQTQNPDEVRFGWKTRDLENDGHFNDDATWVVAREPYDGDEWRELIYPIGVGHPFEGQSMDLAFELTSNVVTTELVIDRLVADDWKCKGKTPVTDAVWWGSYIGYQFKPCHGNFMTLPVKPDYFLLNIWSDVPADTTSTVPFSHPNEMLWEYKAYEYDEVLVGYDKHPHSVPGAAFAREPVFRYSVRIPQDNWFLQEDVNNIYWFSVVAVYESDTDPLYDWGWTNHKHVFNDDAVAGFFDVAVGEWFWEELRDQLDISQDMSFMLFTDPDCLKRTASDYNAWVTYGKPKCWCYDKQCRGDADTLLVFGRPVTLADLDILKAGFAETVAQLFTIPNGFCGDFDHTPLFFRPVTLSDLDILKLYFSVPDASVPQCDQFPIYTGPYNFWTEP